MFKISSLAFLGLFLTLISCEGLKDPSETEEQKTSDNSGGTSGGGGGTGGGGGSEVPKIIAITPYPYSADLGSYASSALNAADSICEHEFDHNYRALLGSSERNLSDSWPLRPNTKYYQEDGVTVIGTTNSSGTFDFPLSNPFTNNPGEYWTGLNADWTVGDNCNDWTDLGADGHSGHGGTNSDALRGPFPVGCSMSFPIVCVEQ